MLKKVSVFLLSFFVGSLIFVTTSEARSENASDDCQGSACQTVDVDNNESDEVSVENSNSTGTRSQNEVQTQERENNPGNGVMTKSQIQERVTEELQTSKPQYAPKGENSKTRANDAEEIVQKLLTLSYNLELENEGASSQLKTLAQNYSSDVDKVNQALDTTEKRTGFAKFFIGPNYKELKEANSVMEQNRERVREMKQIMDQLQNDADKLEIANQIINILDQNIELAELEKRISSGFSLFGWFNKLYNHYN